MAKLISSLPLPTPRFATADTDVALPGTDSGTRTAPETKAGLSRVAAPEPTELRRAFERAKGIHAGNSVSRLVTDNRQAWTERWQALEGATKSIDSTYFAIHKDVFGFAFLGHLLWKQKNNVKVRLLSDAMADPTGLQGFKTAWGGKDYLQELVSKGAEVGFYNPINTRFMDLLSDAILASNHDKILVVDGQQSITGGRNIGHDYFVDSKDMTEAWRDTDIVMEGRDPARGLTDAFDIEFDRERVVRKLAPDRLGNWRNREGELLAAYKLMDLWLKDPPLSAQAKQRIKEDPNEAKAEAYHLADRVAAASLELGLERRLTDQEMSFLRGIALELVKFPESRGAYTLAGNGTEHIGETHILDQTSVDGGRVGNFAENLTSFVLNAKHSIRIENPYIVLTEDMVKALEQASKNGVAIELITNSPLSTDSVITQAFFLDEWAYVLARVPNARIFVATGERKLHAKTAVIDHELTIVSTYNLDFLSGNLNSEVGAATWSKSLATETEASFDSDLSSPENRFVEYTIQRDENGYPVLHAGEPIPTFGPEWHLPRALLERYDAIRKLVRVVRRHPVFKPLDHPTLEELARAGLSPRTVG